LKIPLATARGTDSRRYHQARKARYDSMPNRCRTSL
jgi:hypothetical protein